VGRQRRSLCRRPAPGTGHSILHLSSDSITCDAIQGSGGANVPDFLPTFESGALLLCAAGVVVCWLGGRGVTSTPGEATRSNQLRLKGSGRNSAHLGFLGTALAHVEELTQS
jgi:hypothetical protein